MQENILEDDKFGFGENKRIYEAACARLAKLANDKTAESFRKQIPELRTRLADQERWMRENGYSV